MDDIQQETRIGWLGNFFGVSTSDVVETCVDESDRSDDDDNSLLSDEESSNYSEMCNNFDLKVLYDSWDEYEDLIETFRESLPGILGSIDIRKRIILSNDEDIGITSISPIEYDLKTALSNLIKNKNEAWVNEITRIIINSVQGIESTLRVLQTDSKTTIDYDELYTELAVGVITNIIMETKDNMGECELNRLAIFKCSKCNMITTYLFNEGEQPDMCGKCWSDNKE